ncbi:MAG: hypothetical protein QXI96_02265, partial [Thermofilum sp.]
MFSSVYMDRNAKTARAGIIPRRIKSPGSRATAPVFTAMSRTIAGAVVSTAVARDHCRAFS